jgi:hypothetical protein
MERPASAENELKNNNILYDDKHAGPQRNDGITNHHRGDAQWT